jgi:L-iditol 2-dehydrogenase
MWALTRAGGGTELREIERPRIVGPADARIRVAAVGICRTDLYAAAGALPTPDPLVLGHEASGLVEAVGPAVSSVQPGDRVAVLPWVGCGSCRECGASPARPYRCAQARMLGLDCDGAFAEWMVAPATSLFTLPPELSFTEGAYVEPVAASMAVLNAGLDPAAPGLLYGENRIATLTGRILAAHGFAAVTAYDPEGDTPELSEDGWDWAIETTATTRSLGELVRAVRPGGRIVLKSRPSRRAELDVREVVRKELTLPAVGYAPFSAALSLLAERRIDLSGLFGSTFPAEAWEQAFARSAGAEAAKCFLSFGAGK